MENKSKFDLNIEGDGKISLKERDHHPQKKSSSLLSTIGLMGNTGISIVVPLVGLTLVGKYLDNKYLAGSKITILFILIGFILSLLVLIKIFKSFIQNSK